VALLSRPKVIAVDLDGVLAGQASPSGRPGALRPGALQFLQTLNHLGYYTVIFTANPTSNANEWLRANGLAGLVKEVVNTKPMAEAYIDDKAIRFTGDFAQTLSEIRATVSNTGLANPSYSMQGEK